VAGEALGLLVVVLVELAGVVVVPVVLAATAVESAGLSPFAVQAAQTRVTTAAIRLNMDNDAV
jgi:hypothetical protein